MSHCIEGYIGKPEQLNVIKHGAAYVIPLPQDLAFLPLTDKLYDQVVHPDGWNEPVSGLAKAMSRTGPVVYLRTNYFGGSGTQETIVYDKGEVVEKFGNSEEEDSEAINLALNKYLGVKVGTSDEFDALGLGKHRDNHSWLKSIGVDPLAEPELSKWKPKLKEGRVYQIAHYYGKRPPIPEAVEVEPGSEDGKTAPLYEVTITDIHAFVEKHGPIILSPPGSRPCEDRWFIWVTRGGKFTQC